MFSCCNCFSSVTTADQTTCETVVSRALLAVAAGLPKELIQIIEQYCVDIILASKLGNVQQLPTYLQSQIQRINIDALSTDKIIVTYNSSPAEYRPKKYNEQSLIMLSKNREVYLYNLSNSQAIIYHV